MTGNSGPCYTVKLSSIEHFLLFMSLSYYHKYIYILFTQFNFYMLTDFDGDYAWCLHDATLM